MGDVAHTSVTSPTGITKKRSRKVFSFTNRLANHWRASHNQRQILRLCRQHKNIFLQVRPTRGCGGKPDHFFHFLFDLLLPLHKVILAAPQTIHFTVSGLGPFAEMAEQIFPGRLRALEDKLRGEDVPDSFGQCPLTGMNPRACVLYSRELLEFRRHVFAALQCEPVLQPNSVLLIERIPPQQYYAGKKNSSGASRRSIINHGELREAVEALFTPQRQVVNLQLEKLSMREQIEHFASADIVIAQHGAGLSNALWMSNRARVLEISIDRSDNHFIKLCQSLGVKHHYYQANDDHAVIDLDNFESWVRSLGLNELENASG